MKGRRIGYVRVSSFDQHPGHQLEPLQADRVFTEKASGKDTDRPQLRALLRYAREGDTIVVHSMDRLARNLGDLCHIVLGQTRRGVRIQFLKEGFSFTREDTPTANLLMSVIDAFVEFESEVTKERQLEGMALIKKRQREGIALAKQRGAFAGHRKFLTPERVDELRLRSGNGEKKTALAREFGISRETLYQYLRQRSFAPAVVAAPSADE